MDQAENEKVKIICPVCSAPLTLRQKPGNPNIKVKCPICGNATPFSAYRAPKEAATSDQGGPKTQLPDDAFSIGAAPKHTQIGYLQIAGYNDRFPLREGRNILGRFSAKSQADIKLPSPNNRMSRDHMVIEVVCQPNGEYVYYAYLYKDKVNRTYVDTMMLYPGDKVLLHNGSVLRLPECELRFVIP